MESQQHPDSPVISEVQQIFTAEGLPFPPIPDEMRPAFVEVEDDVWGTRLRIPWLYDIRTYVEEVATKPVEDYVLLGHAGHGIQSYAMHYYLVRGPLAMFLQIGWSGAYTDKDKATETMSLRFTQANELILAVEAAQNKGAFRPDERLIVRDSEFYGGVWTRIYGLQDRENYPKGAWHKGDDVLSAVLSEVQNQ